MDDSELEEEEEPSIDSELDEFDYQIPKITYQIIQLKPRSQPDGKPKDKLHKIDCKSN